MVLLALLSGVQDAVAAVRYRRAIVAAARLFRQGSKEYGVLTRGRGYWYRANVSEVTDVHDQAIYDLCPHLAVPTTWIITPRRVGGRIGSAGTRPAAEVFVTGRQQN